MHKQCTSWAVCTVERTEPSTIDWLFYVLFNPSKMVRYSWLNWHTICVYTIHQNAKLLVNATKTGHTYKQLMEMTKLVWFTDAKNVLGQYGNTLRTLNRLKMTCIRSLFTTAVSWYSVVFLTILNMTLNLVLKCNAIVTSADRN